MTIRKKIKHDITYCLIRLFMALCNILPRNAAMFVGAWLGLAAWKLIPREQHRVHRHLSLVYQDDINYEQKRNIGRSFFINSGKNLADVVRFRRHFATEIRPLISVEGLEHWEAAYRRGRGVLGVAGHLGNFELLAAYVQSLGYDIAVIGREMYDPRLDKLLVENRLAVGLTNIATSDSPRRLLAWLRSGKGVGVLIDTDSPRVRGIFVPVFGRLANTPVGQSMIGLKTGSAFLPSACLRTPDNRYRVVFKPPIELKPSGDFETDVYQVTLKCTKALEEIIEEHKEQWIWLHNRWRTKV